jgi:hypothetical protein
MNTKMQNYKTIFSLRIRIALREKGFEPIMESPNPYKKGLKCWVYNATPEFMECLNEIMGGYING